MSFLSVLGKIGKAALPFIPGVGPIASTALNAVEQIAGGASKQRAEDRGAQAEYDALRIPLQNSQALQYSDARLAAERARMRQLGGADLLSNFKAPTDPRAATFLNNGQLRGGQVNPETIQMLRDRAMSALSSGSDVPQMQGMPEKPGGGGTKMDTFLNILSGAGTGLGALREAGINVYTGNARKPQTGSGPIGQVRFPNEQGSDVPWWSPLKKQNTGYF